MNLYFTSGQFGESQTLRKSEAFSKWLGNGELDIEKEYFGIENQNYELEKWL